MQTSETNFRPRQWKDYLRLAACGFCMGVADVIPGVSGGTMAFILGIYEELINALHSINLPLSRHLAALRLRAVLSHLPWRFFLALGLGLATAIFTLAEGVSWLLDNHPTLVWSFFFGLILASVVAVRRRVSQWNFLTLLTVIMAALVAYLVVGAVPVQTPDAPWFLFLSGAIAICAMILPGISGAFILVLLGQYERVLEAVIRLDLPTLIIFMAGCAIGLLSFARVLRWLFRHYPDLTVAALIGLMVGSLRKIWPFKETLTWAPDRHGHMVPDEVRNVLPAELSLEVIIALALVAGGFGLVMLLEYLAGRYMSAPSNTL
jgi:putative membrane protein